MTLGRNNPNLTQTQKKILFEKGTEAPFTGKFLKNTEKGMYICANCGKQLFSSETKFDSNSGWPSFYNVSSPSAVKLNEDLSGGMHRVEVECANCGGHLGHVFNDAPSQPTGMRFCINSCALDFKPKMKGAKKDINDKPKRLIFKTYKRFIQNSVDSKMFRNFYVADIKNGEFDALLDGENSCAFFVSAVLVVFDKIGGIHGTVGKTLEDMQKSGWVEVKKPIAGDVLVWEKLKMSDGWHEHIGFYIGSSKAISNSSSRRAPALHDKNFNGQNRKIIKILRMKQWD